MNVLRKEGLLFNLLYITTISIVANKAFCSANSNEFSIHKLQSRVNGDF